MSLENQLRTAKENLAKATAKSESLKEASKALNELEDELTAERNRLKSSANGMIWIGEAHDNYKKYVTSVVAEMNNANKDGGKLEGPKDKIDAAERELPIKYFKELISNLERDIAKLAEDIVDTFVP